MAQEVQIAPGVIKQVLTAPTAGAQSVQAGRTVTVHCTGYLKSSMKKFWRYM